MKRFPVLLLLLSAGCATPTPQENLTLFDSAEERSRQDLLAVYYWEPIDAVVSVVVPRGGPAEARGEMQTLTQAILSLQGSRLKSPWRKNGIPVESSERAAIDAYFSALPAGTSERTLSMEPRIEVDTFESNRLERVEPTRVRILYVSGSGEVKRLTYVKGDATLLPGNIPSGGKPLAALDALFLGLVRK